ncbi:MAG: acyltransferase [Muribaculaceae bacterium]|nr:acyltransferase [Muribaculaceae bacterium]
MSAQRQPYFDFLRGIAIMMVVAIHTMPVEICSFDSLKGISSIAFRQTLNCAVPVFLAISGYFIGRKDLSNKNNIFTFYKKQIPRVYIPCLIFSIGFLLIDIIIEKNNPITSLIMLICCGFGIYYFIALIIQFYLLTPFLIKFNKWGGLICALVISLTSIVLLNYMTHIAGHHFPLIISAGPFYLWIVFFMMGLWYAKHSRDYSIIPAIAIIIIGLILSVLETKYYYSLRQNSGLGIKISSFIYSIGVIMLTFSTKLERIYNNNIITSTVAYIGEVSFGIYLVHMYVVTIVRHILPVTNWALSWIATLVVTICLIMFSKWLLPAKFNRRYFGF